MKTKALTLLLCVWAGLAFAEISLDGFLDFYYAAKTKNFTYNSNKTRLRTQLSGNVNDIYFFSSVNIAKHSQQEDAEFNLHEAYIEYVGSNYDFRIGKQIITWGKADGVRITDILNPADYSMFITGDFDDIRVPINMLKFRYLPSYADFEFILIPNFKQRQVPKKGSTWYIEKKTKHDVAEEAINLPKKSLENIEIAGKVSLYLAGFDFAFSGMYFFDDSPVYVLKQNILIPQFKRCTFLGIEANKVLGEFVLRIESAGFIDKAFQIKENYVSKNFVKSMLGIDWYANSNLTLSTQFANDYILNYEDKINNDESVSITTLNVSYKMLNQTLELTNMVYYNFNDEDVYNKAQADYAFTDDLHFLIGYDYFGGDKGMYGRYSNNSQVWCKAKFNF